MNEIDFAQKASLGQYLPGDSHLHKLNPGVKLVLVILLLTAFLITSPLFGNLAGIIIIMLMGCLSGIPLSYLFRNTKPMIPFLLLISLMQLFFTQVGGSSILAQWGRFTITAAGVFNSLAIFLRFIAIIGLLTLFTSLTPSREIGHGTENLFSPLKKIGFPANELSLIVTITFRFIPILAEEAENLMKAQVSRGALLGTQKNPIKRIMAYMPLAVPLFISALERAEQLAEAMEARCYKQGEERSRYITYSFTRRDIIALISAVVILFFLIFLKVFKWEYKLLALLGY
jgi:energy-coupling factor transport system permease protein